ncbi:hypothetical protein ABUW04_26355 [Streptacidiphilus sp. N1-10]|uniref:Uncharacterized protein n=1 Tax=Streptacidiphilus jeojiensis TaxID=3229225 RepID=A0ABV6XU58_9ACTN
MTESLLGGGPVRRANRHRAHSLRPGPGRDHPQPVHEALQEPEAWDDPGWDDEGTVSAAAGSVPEPTPMTARTPALAPRPAALPCEAPAVPPRRTVGPFPPIRAGGGRHRLPAAVRRRPGPIAAGLMVAATTLAAGSLRGIPVPPAGHPAAAGAPLHIEVVDDPPQE